MMKPIRMAVALSAATMLLGGLAAPAFADDATLTTNNNGSAVAATAGINAGDRTAVLAGAIAFPAVNADHNIQSATAQSTSIEVNDLSASDAGWNVTISSSNLLGTSGPALAVPASSYAGGTIPAADLSVSTLPAPAVAVTPLSTDVGVGVTTNIVPVTPASIGSSGINLLSAPLGFGVGDYTETFGVGLQMPADSLAGDYAGTLTVTIAPPVGTPSYLL
jgi:hypothetical protein